MALIKLASTENGLYEKLRDVLTCVKFSSLASVKNRMRLELATLAVVDYYILMESTVR